MSVRYGAEVCRRGLTSRGASLSPVLRQEAPVVTLVLYGSGSPSSQADSTGSPGDPTRPSRVHHRLRTTTLASRRHNYTFVDSGPRTRGGPGSAGRSESRPLTHDGTPPGRQSTSGVETGRLRVTEESRKRLNHAHGTGTSRSQGGPIPPWAKPHATIVTALLRHSRADPCSVER